MSNITKVITLYKKDNKITTRKPKKVQEFIPFSVPSKSSLNSVKTFLKYVITDIKELNLVKNDVCFLINEIFGRLEKDHTTNTEVMINDGIIFYVWVYLPYEYNLNQFETPHSVREDIFPFDLYYVRQNMSHTGIKQIQDILRNEVNIHVRTRRPGENIMIPHIGLKALVQ